MTWTPNNPIPSARAPASSPSSPLVARAFVAAAAGDARYAAVAKRAMECVLSVGGGASAGASAAVAVAVAGCGGPSASSNAPVAAATPPTDGFDDEHGDAEATSTASSEFPAARQARVAAAAAAAAVAVGGNRHRNRRHELHGRVALAPRLLRAQRLERPRPAADAGMARAEGAREAHALLSDGRAKVYSTCRLQPPVRQASSHSPW